jgi:hypothetical protein
MVMHHAFVDESIRPGRYLLTLVLVPSHAIAPITRQVRDLFPRGNRRTHLSAESKARRRELLKAYGCVATDVRVFVAAYAGGDDHMARNACLVAAVAQSTQWRVAMLVLDSRGPHRDALDRRCLAAALRGTTTRLQYTHRGSRDEPLLCLPDAIGWAVGAGGMWRRIVDPVVTEVIDVTP